MMTGSPTENTHPFHTRVPRDFFTRDVLEVAPEILGKVLSVRDPEGRVNRFVITETEAYRGSEDKACHASRGRTQRTDIMYHSGGKLYIYLIYGIHWMLNIVAGGENEPQAVLIRSFEQCSGPGRVTKLAGIDRSFNGEDLIFSERIWLEDHGMMPVYKTDVRIGIDYAGEYWRSRPWRYFV